MDSRAFPSRRVEVLQSLPIYTRRPGGTEACAAVEPRVCPLAVVAVDYGGTFLYTILCWLPQGFLTVAVLTSVILVLPLPRYGVYVCVESVLYTAGKRL